MFIALARLLQKHFVSFPYNVERDEPLYSDQAVGVILDFKLTTIKPLQNGRISVLTSVFEIVELPNNGPIMIRIWAPQKRVNRVVAENTVTQQHYISTSSRQSKAMFCHMLVHTLSGFGWMSLMKLSRHVSCHVMTLPTPKYWYLLCARSMILVYRSNTLTKRLELPLR
jgi:hypothetical protein